MLFTGSKPQSKHIEWGIYPLWIRGQEPYNYLMHEKNDPLSLVGSEQNFAHII